MNNVNKILEIVAEILELEIEDVNVSTELDEDNWDSLAVVSFISEIDSEFDIVVSPAKVTAAKSVDELIKLVK